MTPEVAQFSNKGMNQDISVSKATNEFAFENYNIRITAVNDNTLLSVTNEKLPLQLNVSITTQPKVLNKVTVVKKFNSLQAFCEYPTSEMISVFVEEESVVHELIIRKGEIKSSEVTTATTPIIKSISVEYTDLEDLLYLYYVDEENIPEQNVETLSYIPGKYLGHSILNKKLVLFTKKENIDNIIVLKIQDNTLVGEIKYSGNLNFQLDKPIETLPYYESELVQKVYWVDGVNQPRVINIESKTIVKNKDTQFDFNPTITKFPEVNITKEYSGVGLFPAGVIQYFVSYYNKYGAETGIVWSSDLQYVTEYNRAAGPDETVVCNFKIDISNVDTTYDYARVYSMQRTSLNTTPICRIVGDININNSDSITIIDTNTNTETIDPTTLLFLGGDSFIASTITQKDDTLFLGNLEIDNKVLDTNVKNAILEEAFAQEDSYTSQIIKFIRKPIDVENQSNAGEELIKTFKYGERYRFALQFQDKELSWTVPVWVGDKDCDYCPQSMEYITYVASAAVYISDNLKNTLKSAGYINYRLLIAEASNNDRKILAQGIVNPTVFNYEQRCNKTGPYAQTSWILRPENGAANSSHLTGLGNSKTTIENIDTFENLDTCEIQNSFNKNPLKDNTFETGYVLNIKYRNYTRNEEERGYYAISVLGAKRSLDVTIDSLSVDNIDTVSMLETDKYDRHNYSEVAEDIIDTFTDFLKIQNIGISEEDLANFLRRSRTGEKLEVNTLIPNSNNWYSGGFDSTKKLATLDSLFKVTEDSPDNEGCVYCYTFINTNNIIGDSDYNNFKNSFYVDSNIVTFHSPDLNETTNVLDNTNIHFKITGIVPITEERTDVEIRTKTSGYSGTSFVKKTLNKTVLNSPLYEDNVWSGTTLNKNYIADYYVYLWQKDGSIIGQTSESTNIDNNIVYADLDHKIFGYFKKSNQTYYWNYLSESTYKNGFEYSIIPRLFETSNVEIKNLNVGANKEYYQNSYESVSTTNEDYRIFWKDFDNKFYQGTINQKSPVSIKYKTIPHVAFSLGSYVLPSYDRNQYLINLELFYNLENVDFEEYTTPWLNSSISKSYKQDNQENFDWFPPEPNEPYFYLGELRRNIQDEDFFGGKDDITLQSLKWIPASKSYNVNEMINISFGDTYYQRWNLVHSIPFTTSDQNSVVDTLSFLVETRTNVLGDYSSVNPEENTLNISEENTGKINPVYSQSNNYFSYNILDEKFDNNKYSNQVAFSLQKTSTSNIDTWCNISLASAFNLNGNYGKLNKLITINDAILAFQDKALSVINFNNRTAISTENGVPIEIANSGKVNGYSVISSNVGCQNKLSICEASSGVYFIDDLNKTMYGFNREGLSNISSKGMSMWFKKNLTGEEKCFYDRLTNDVYVTNNIDCLVYNEALDTFTSFMDYSNINSLFNFEGKSFIFDGDSTVNVKQMFEGEYTNDYFTTYKINPEPLTDKIFTNVEFIADVFKDDSVIDSNNVNINVDKYPFDVLEVWNEYQKGITNIPGIKYRYPNASKKFRICRIDVPRDSSNGRDRIRNPWMYLKLSKNSINDSTKMVFHNLLVKYYK